MTSPRLAVLAILSAMVIFGANFGVSRFATLRGMTPADLVLLRFAVAGPLLLPVFLRRGGFRTCASLGWRRGIILAVIGGAPMSLFMNTGLSLAPAAHGAALGPGTVTAVGVVYGILVARLRPPSATILGLLAIACGLATIAVAGSVSGAGSTALGDLFFFITGLLWGFYPILLHRWRVEPITGTAIVAVLSLVYVPVYLALEPPRLLGLSPGLLVFQAVFQGVFNIVVALWLWGHAVKVLGAGRIQFFPPLIPVLGTLLAIPIVGELPGPLQWSGLALIVGGILLALVGQRLAAVAASLRGEAR